MEQTEPRRRRVSLLAVLLILFLVGGILAAAISLYSAPALSPAAASATAEAKQFATAEVARQSTSVSIRRTATTVARASSTAEAVARSTRLVQASSTAVAAAQSTSTANAVASAIAPSTQTAEASTEADRRAQADAVTQRLQAQANVLYGPANGSLGPHTDETASCIESNLALHNFIAAARFYNPASVTQNSWEYGIVFSNEGDDTNFIFSIRSAGNYALRLSGGSFFIETNNSTDLIDLSRTGDNKIKLYVNEGIAYLYINDFYADTVDLRNLAYGQTSALDHNPMACASLGDPDAKPPPAPTPTRYEDFTVWSLP